MAKISDLSDELLVKILSFLPIKVAVSTSILSKQWEFLWMWSPNLEFGRIDNGSMRNFINKNLSLHRAPIIKRLQFNFFNRSNQADDFKTWVGIAVSRGLHELSISYDSFDIEVCLVLPSTLYTCNSLVTLNLDGTEVLVDVPRTFWLPSLKKLHLRLVTYSTEDSLRLLLGCCPVLEDLHIERHSYDNVKALVIVVPSLQRLYLIIDQGCSDDGCVIVTPSLKYFRVQEERRNCSYLIEHMPQVEEADISVFYDSYLGNIFKSISAVKRLSLRVMCNSANEALYGDGILFSQLQNLKLCILSENWSKIAFQLLKNSPNLQVLYLKMQYCPESYLEYEPVGWSDDEGLVPKCLLRSLKSLKFKAFFTMSTGDEEGRYFLSFIIKHACCLKSVSFLD